MDRLQLPLIQIRHGAWPPEESVGISPPSSGALVSCLDFPTVSSGCNVMWHVHKALISDAGGVRFESSMGSTKHQEF